MSRTKPRMRDRRVQALTSPAERTNEDFPNLSPMPAPRGHRECGSTASACQGGGFERSYLPTPGTDTIPFVGEEILREFARYRHRHLWVRGVDLFLEAAFVMTVTAAAMLLVDRLA
jgi:hypothetical protein